MKATEKKFDITPFDPCDEVLDYYNSKASLEDFWRDCERGDWMLWLAAMLHVDKRLLVKAAAMCANTVRHLMKDSRSTDAVDAALRYANGKIGEDELKKHADAAKAYADDAAYDAHAAKADYVAHAAFFAKATKAKAVDAAKAKVADAFAAVRAAGAAADACADAACAGAGAYSAAACAAAAAAATDAAYDAAYDAAATANQLQTANICREVLTEAVLEKVSQH